MPEALTKVERRILDYLIEYLRKNTYQPSIREIGKRFGIKSTKTVSEHLQALADKGYIERDASRSRGVRIMGMNLYRKLVHAPDAFFLRAEGDSMEGMGILDGDLVLVEPTAQDEIQPGEIVAARLGGKATVKRYFSRDGSVVLEPANTSYAPILVHDYEDFSLLGRVTGLFRRFTADHTATIGG